MRRRDFVTLIAGGAAAAWPLGAQAQQGALPLVGVMHAASAADNGYIVDAIRQGLNTAGFVDGQNVVVEFHWAEGHYDGCRRWRTIWFVVMLR